jgi:Flp pilus assembly protein CpaB
LAIEGSGKRLLVLEAVAVGALVLAAYQLWNTWGKQKVTKTVTITVNPDKTLTVRQELVEENYSIGEILGNAVKAALG